MKSRMDLGNSEPRIYQAMQTADETVASFELDAKLKELVKVRVSQLNGCGYCVDYHSRDARKLGETERRLFALSAWWETPFFSDEERAVLKLAEEVTLIANGGVSDQTYEKAVRFVGETKVAQIIFLVATTGTWNRLAISTHMVAETE